MDEWKLENVNMKAQKPLVTIRNLQIGFNSYFVKVAELDKKTRVSLKFTSGSMKVGFWFHNDLNIPSHALTKDGGPRTRESNNRGIQANQTFNNNPWLKAVAKLDYRLRQYEPKWDSAHSLWVISICPPFETRVSDRSEIPSDLYGIYRYKIGENIVYIGRGAIKSRARSPEREDWNFETIEYSIVTDETEQKKWEAYWLDRFVEQCGKLPFYNRIAGEKPKVIN